MYVGKSYLSSSLWNLQPSENPLRPDELIIKSYGPTFTESLVQREGYVFNIITTGSYNYSGAVVDASAVTGFHKTVSIYFRGELMQYESYDPGYDIVKLLNYDFDYELSLLKGNDIFEGSPDMPEGDGVQGREGNDRFTGYGDGEYGDYFDGGSGIDTAVYRGKRGDYNIEFSRDIWDSIQNDGSRLSGFVVTDKIQNRDGEDRLIDVERLKFSDISIALDIEKGENAGAVYRLYEAAFNRAPKPVGEGYWLKKMDSGETLTQIAAQFIQTDEFRSIYGENPTPVNYVYKLFNNILGRDPKAAGLNYYLDMLEKKTMADVLAHISESDENIQNTAPLIANGIPYQEIP
jgi:Domain of unknown function (DUF4214)